MARRDDCPAAWAEPLRRSCPAPRALRSPPLAACAEAGRQSARLTAPSERGSLCSARSIRQLLFGGARADSPAAALRAENAELRAELLRAREALAGSRAEAEALRGRLRALGAEGSPRESWAENDRRFLNLYAAAADGCAERAALGLSERVQRLERQLGGEQALGCQLGLLGALSNLERLRQSRSLDAGGGFPSP